MYTSIYMHWLNNNVRNFIISRKPFHMIFKKNVEKFQHTKDELRNTCEYQNNRTHR